MNLFSVGTQRDGEKWPRRDGRKAPARRDLVTFGVFTPYTAEKMRAGRAVLLRLHERTPREKTTVQHGGVFIKRLLFRKCARYCAQGITCYLNGRILDHLEAATAATTWSQVQDALEPHATIQDPLEWTDVGGLLMPVERRRNLESEIASGAVRSLAALTEKFSAVAGEYAQDEWAYVCAAFEMENGFSPSAMSREQAQAVLAAYDEAAGARHASILDDSKKEFAAFARVGYGLGMTEEERLADFTAVRGSADTNAVVQQLVQEQVSMAERSARLREWLAHF